MPKVSVEYIEEKKNRIMDCAMSLLQEIPLYQITMRDIIKKLDYSQGVIYRYYQGIDEIFVDVMNRETQGIEFSQNIEHLINEDLSDYQKINSLFSELGNYILNVQQKVGGKFYFEMMVSYAFDKAKQQELLPQLIFKQNLMLFQSKMVNYIETNIKNGVFSPDKPIALIVTYTGATIDGIGNHSALTGHDHIELIRSEILTLFALLAQQLIDCLNIRPQDRS